MPATDRYRLALLRAYAESSAEVRAELSLELNHQRFVERRFVQIEIYTLIFVAVAAGFIGCIGIILIVANVYVAGAITLAGDIYGLARIAAKRSYFIPPVPGEEQRAIAKGDEAK